MALITPYLSQQPVDDFGLPFAGLKYACTVTASSDTTLTVPGTAPRYKAVIKCEPAGHVWVALNATAAAANAGTFAATTSELLTEGQKMCREVKAGDVLHFYSISATTDVSVVFYALGTPN